MTLRNFTVSHVSPLITYVPGMLWSENGVGQDTLAVRAACVGSVDYLA